MKLKITTILLVLVSVFMASLINVNAQMGIGVSPGEIVINNAFRGGEYEELITIFNGNEDDGNFSLSATGSISDWFSFYDENDQPINQIPIKGKSSEQVFVRVNIPDGAANENFSSSIHIETGEGTPIVLFIDVEVR